MKAKHLAVAVILVAFVFAPLYAQVEPGTGDETALDVIADLEDTSLAYEAFGDEFADYLEGEDQVAFFAPTDDALEAAEIDDVAVDELQALFARHTTTGLAADVAIEFIEWFGTMDGAENEVAVEEDTVVINDSAEIVEAIPAENGVVYVIDEAL